MGVQLAEMPAERLLAVEIERLVAEEDHLVLEQRGVDLLELPVAQLPQPHLANLRADARGDGPHLDRLVRHRLPPLPVRQTALPGPSPSTGSAPRVSGGV